MREITIRTLLERIEAKELVLPAMQRPFVWQEERIVRLMDSLMRRFPIGTVLVWETGEAQRYRHFAQHASIREQPLLNYPEVEAGRKLQFVLDGQQRLTSLNIACNGSLDGRLMFLDVLSGDPNDKDPGDMYFDFRFLTAADAEMLNTEVEEDRPRHCFVPFKMFREFDILDVSRYCREFVKKRRFPDDLADRVNENFILAVSILASTKPLQVHVVDEHGQTKTPITEILELFVRVNSGGLVLQKSDLLMSLLDLSWNDVQPELLRVADVATRNSPVPVSRDLILKTVLLMIGEESRFDKLVKDRDRIERIAPDLRATLPSVEKGWLKLGVLLRMNCRINSPRFFRQASNALLPFAVWLSKNHEPSREDEHRLVTGIHLAIMSGVFGGAEARMGGFARDYCRTENEFPLRRLAHLVRANRPVTGLDSLLCQHLDLALNIAQRGVVLDGNPDELERDHIFPRSKLATEGYPESQINHYANFHFLRGKDNRNKTDRPPHEWFASPAPNAAPYSKQDMEERLLTWELVRPGAFPVLLQKRGERIRMEACRLFHMSEAEFNQLFD